MKFLSVIAIVLGLSSISQANEWQPYSKETFNAAKQEGKTVVVDFKASWCSVCKRRQPILQSIIQKPDFSNAVALVADFDEEKELKKELGVSKQSTTIVFKGDKEVARSIGDTNSKRLETMLRKGI